MGDVSLNRPINTEGNRILDLMSAGWTNERHSLYISSMEASFVEQLHGHGHHGPDTSRNQADCNANGNGNGFKVLRQGVWENLRFERSNAHARGGGIGCLPENPWIRRFRPRNAAVNRRGDRVKALVDDDESGTDTIRERVRVHGRESRSCVGENLVVKGTEVSDQNFRDEEVQVSAEPSKPCKKSKPTPSTAVPNDHVVPSSGKSDATTKAGGSRGVLKKA